MKKKTKKQQNSIKTPVDELKDELGTSIAIKTLHDSEGGQILINGLVSDVIGAMDSLMNNVSTYSHIEIVAMVCKMKERVDIIRVLTGAKARQEVYQDLLEEELKKEEVNPPKEENIIP